MNSVSEEEIARLLRLKRYERPPPGYFEHFLHEFHRRQRDELLRQPLWYICIQRAQNLVSRLKLPSRAYPVAVAAVLVCTPVILTTIFQRPQAGSVAQKRFNEPERLADSSLLFTPGVENRFSVRVIGPGGEYIVQPSLLPTSSRSGPLMLPRGPLGSEPVIRFELERQSVPNWSLPDE
jgi:hypothetical protein